MQNISEKQITKIISSMDKLELLDNISNEWSSVLKEKDDEIKIKKLYSALVKETMRRETADKIAKNSQHYSEIIQEQTKQRISDLKESLEGQIAFLRTQIKSLKEESTKNLDFYRDALRKAIKNLADAKK